jgi:hypothetical protein
MSKFCMQELGGQTGVGFPGLKIEPEVSLPLKAERSMVLTFR